MSQHFQSKSRIVSVPLIHMVTWIPQKFYTQKKTLSPKSFSQHHNKFSIKHKVLVLAYFCKYKLFKNELRQFTKADSTWEQNKFSVAQCALVVYTRRTFRKRDNNRVCVMNSENKGWKKCKKFSTMYRRYAFEV